MADGLSALIQRCLTILKLPLQAVENDAVPDVFGDENENQRDDKKLFNLARMLALLSSQENEFNEAAV
jgi:hypothetical protein